MVQKTFKVASVLDSALDLDAMHPHLLEYARERNETLLKIKPGRDVTWFHLRRIPTSLMDRFVLEAPGLSEQNRRAFRVGVVQVQNLIATDEQKFHAINPSGKMDTAAAPLTVWTEEEMELFAPQYTQEIGAVARQRSFLVPGNAPSLLLPPSSAEEYRRRVYPVVERLGMIADPSSEQPTSAQKASGSNTQEPTAAPATAKATDYQDASPTGADS